MQIEWSQEKVEIREAGSGPSLLLVHGYPLDGAMWSSVARRLAARFRVVKPDLPGRAGNPTGPSASLENYVDFVEAVLENLEAPVGLAGFSMGGYISLALMRRQPPKVAALALVDTRAVADDEAGKKKRDESIAILKDSGVEPIADAILPKLLSPDGMTRKDLVERVRRIILRQTPAALESDLAAMRDRKDSTDLLRELALPTLVAAGEHDAISPAAEGQALAHAIPGARFVQIAGAGHLTPMEAPAAVAKALRDFFSETLGARG